jgi:hypothetical protein
MRLWNVRLESLTKAGTIMAARRLKAETVPEYETYRQAADVMAKEIVLDGTVEMGTRLKMVYESSPDRYRDEVIASPEIQPEEFVALVEAALDDIPHWASRFEDERGRKMRDIAEYAEEQDKVTAKMVFSYAGFRAAVTKLQDRDDGR